MRSRHLHGNVEMEAALQGGGAIVTHLQEASIMGKLMQRSMEVCYQLNVVSGGDDNYTLIIIHVLK